jgi:hypothetical protein
MSTTDADFRERLEKLLVEIEKLYCGCDVMRGHTCQLHGKLNEIRALAAPAGPLGIAEQTVKDAVIYAHSKFGAFTQPWFETLTHAINRLAAPASPRAALTEDEQAMISMIRRWQKGHQVLTNTELLLLKLAALAPAPAACLCNWPNGHAPGCPASAELNSLKGRVKDLEDWKQSAVNSIPDWQKIGEALGLQVGVSVPQVLLTEIFKLKNEVELWKIQAKANRYGVNCVCEWKDGKVVSFCGAHAMAARTET